MWPPGKYDDAPETSDRVGRPSRSQLPTPGSSNRSDPPESANDVLDRGIKYWQSAGLQQGPVGRGRMVEMSRASDPDWEHRVIASQRTGPSYDDSNLFKSPEQIAAEQRRWQQLLSRDDDNEQRETYKGEREDVKRAMFPYDHKGKATDFHLKDDDFPPL